MGPTSPNSPTAQHLAAPSSEAGSPPGGAGSNAGCGTVYASADAARVGGGLYQHLLHAVVTLATDPAPTVAAVGAAVLRVAGVELAEPTRLPGGPPFTVLPCIKTSSLYKNGLEGGLYWT